MKWSVEKFISTRTHNKKLYENAAKKLYLDPFGSEARVKTFVKAEKLNLTAKPDPDPRVIQPRPLGYNILLGCFLAPLEGVLYKAIAKVFGSVTVMKGMNASQQGELLNQKWNAVDDPCWIGLDVSRMDQHVNEPLLRYEHSVYKRVMPGKELADLLRKQLKNYGAGACYDGMVKYAVRARRMSGDMNTGLGNCLIICAIVWTLMAPCDFHYELADNGDDCGLIVPRHVAPAILPRVRPFFARLGLPVKVQEPVVELEKVVFCQTQPVFNGEGWTMVRDPRIVLDKDANTLKPVRTEQEWNTLRASISDCGSALAGHMPVFCAFYEMLGRGAGSRIDRDLHMDGMRYLARGMNMRGAIVTNQARVSFYRAFDIGPDQQHALEARFRSMVPRWETPRVWRESDVDGVTALLTGSTH
jgi:hypothetical protein